MVESGGVSDPENAVGDGGKAIGPYQIHEVYWKDANSFDSSLGGTYQNCKGSGSFNYSERVMQVIITVHELAYNNIFLGACMDVHSNYSIN